MCQYIKPFDTNTQLVLLMHPKEFRKTKNRTGHFTSLSLNNSSIHIGIDFTNNKKINELIDNENNCCYILYPGENSLNLNKDSIKNNINNDKNIVIFIIDSTWSCSIKILRESKNLKSLKRISFTHTKESAYTFKTQPNKQALSTIESTLVLLEILNEQKIENISKENFENFLTPFNKMVEFQLQCINNPRYKTI